MLPAISIKRLRSAGEPLTKPISCGPNNTHGYLPTSSESTFEFAGIVKFDQASTQILFDTITEMSHEEGFLDMQLPALFQRLILKGHSISTEDIPPDLWIDIDFPRDIHHAEKTILPNILSQMK